MKVKWNGKTDFLVLTNGKIYEVLSVEKGWYRIVDDSGSDYLYPPEEFTVIGKAEPVLRKQGDLFHEDMTYPESLTAFFKAIDGKSDEEVARIRAEYDKIIPAIAEREIDDSNQLTSYKV